MTAPIKVLHVLSGGTIGGAESHVVSLLRGLSDTGNYELHLAYFTEKPDSARSLKPDVQQLGIQTHDLKATAKLDPMGFIRLARLIQQQRFDIVHSHSIRSLIGTAVLIGLLRYPGALVTSVHSEDPLLEYPVISSIVSLAGRWVNSVIAISNIVRQHIIRHTRISPEKIHKIYYGLDPQPAKESGDQDPINLRQEYGLSTDTRLIVVVARLGIEKGHRYAIEAMPGILKRVPKVKLLIVGHEDSISEADLAKIADANDVRKDVIFCGFRQDVPGVLQQADLLILPSLREGFGLVLLEAMSAHCPIVASDTGAISEVVLDGGTGTLVPPADPDSLSEAITAILSNPDLSTKFVKSGYQRLLQEFSIDRMVAETDSLYKNILLKHK